MVEIRCPSNCPHLTASREHPASQIRRQQQQDAAALLPTVRHLTERQYQVYFLLAGAIVRHRTEGFARLVDEDIAEAASACASTLETAARGVIYRHEPRSLLAQRLAHELTAMVAEVRTHGATVFDHEVAVALRAVEAGCRDARRMDEGDAGYLRLLGRLLPDGQPPETLESTAGPTPEPPKSLLLP